MRRSQLREAFLNAIHPSKSLIRGSPGASAESPQARPEVGAPKLRNSGYVIIMWILSVKALVEQLDPARLAGTGNFRSFSSFQTNNLQIFARQKTCTPGLQYRQKRSSLLFKIGRVWNQKCAEKEKIQNEPTFSSRRR